MSKQQTPRFCVSAPNEVNHWERELDNGRVVCPYCFAYGTTRKLKHNRTKTKRGFGTCPMYDYLDYLASMGVAIPSSLA